MRKLFRNKRGIDNLRERALYAAMVMVGLFLIGYALIDIVADERE